MKITDAIKIIINYVNNHETKKEMSRDIRDHTLQPFIREENLEVVCDTKLLGVQIDENLTWKNQIKSVTDKASRAIGFLKYAKYFLLEVVVKNLYNSIVEPHTIQ